LTPGLAPGIPRALKTTHRGLTVVALLLAIFLSAMEMTVVSTAMPTAVGELGGLHLGWPIASTLSGRLLPRLGYRPLIAGGLGLTVVASVALVAALRPGTSAVTVGAITALYGLGLGFANTPLVIAVQTSVPWNRRGVATAATMFFRTIGGTVAVGILGGVLAASLTAAGVPPGAADALLGPERGRLDPAALAGAAGALQAGMTRTLWAVCALAGASFLAGLAFPSVPVGGTARPAQAAAPADEVSPRAPSD
jgi:MFS family permease